MQIESEFADNFGENSASEGKDERDRRENADAFLRQYVDGNENLSPQAAARLRELVAQETGPWSRDLSKIRKVEDRADGAKIGIVFTIGKSDIENLLLFDVEPQTELES